MARDIDDSRPAGNEDGDELARLTALLPRSVPPPRDLWPGIEARLPRRAAHWGWAPGPRLLQLAAALLMVAFGIWLGRSFGPWEGRATTTGNGRQIAMVAASDGEGALLGAEREYLLARAHLRQALASQSAALSPEARATVERNLEILDRAMAEIRGALAAHPESLFLEQQLLAQYRRDAETLRRLVRHV